MTHRRLGSLTFEKLGEPIGIWGWLGARRFQYGEAYYFGNPGLYHVYMVGVNDAGITTDVDVSGIKPLLGSGWDIRLGWIPGGASHKRDDRLSDFLRRPQVRQFRAASEPNTYGVATMALREQLSSLGVDKDRFRTLPSRL